MIKIETYEENMILMKIYYDNGLKWIFADTFEEYEDSIAKRGNKVLGWKSYYVWDMETLKRDGYIRANDTYEMSVNYYLRQLKLERIIK